MDRRHRRLQHFRGQTLLAGRLASFHLSVKTDKRQAKVYQRLCVWQSHFAGSVPSRGAIASSIKSSNRRAVSAHGVKDVQTVGNRLVTAFFKLF
jgi:hypothetical protein